MGLFRRRTTAEDRTIAFEELRKKMAGTDAKHRQEGVPPPWIQEVTDWALNEAIEDMTFSSPWEKGLLQTEKDRRDQANVLRSTIWGGIGGAMVTVLFQVVSWLWRLIT
jgi:hypothetical protein